MEWSLRVSGVCDCAKATMTGQFVGCSLGCSDCHAWEDPSGIFAPDAGAGTAPKPVARWSPALG